MISGGLKKARAIVHVHPDSNINNQNNNLEDKQLQDSIIIHNIDVSEFSDSRQLSSNVLNIDQGSQSNTSTILNYSDMQTSTIGLTAIKNPPSSSDDEFTTPRRS